MIYRDLSEDLLRVVIGEVYLPPRNHTGNHSMIHFVYVDAPNPSVCKYLLRKAFV